MQISKYFASLSIEIDKSSVKNVDKTLNDLEKKLKKLGGGFGKSIGFNINPSVDQKKLEYVLSTALDVASSRVTFEISRFSVNQRNLQAALMAAGPLGEGGVSQVGQVRTRSPSPEQLRRSAIRNAEWDRQERVRTSLADRRFGLQGQRLDLQASRLNGGNAAVSGAVAGGASRVRGMPSLLGPALALGLGGYGLSNLNERNQQVVSAQLQTSAVVQQAGGTAQQGSDSFQYLRSEGQRIGYNFLDASQDYNKLISGLTGSGIGLKESQKVFSGFAELARVNKLDKTTQNRLFRALSQVAGKGKLMSEELTGQIAEALPGGTALFAQAYQKQIGGNKTGSDAIQQLLADMKKGKVKSDILTFAGTAASQRANQGGALAAASTASQAEQARYQNTVNDLAVVASNAGVEEGFARIFRTLNNGLSESNGLVRTLSEGFNEATKWADDLLLWPQSFVRALEGKDSVVADWLGKENTDQLKQDWKDIKQIFTDISSIKFDFLPDLKSTSQEIASIMNAIAEFQRWKSGNLPTQTTELGDIETIDPFGLGGYKSPKGIFDAILNNTGVNLNRAIERKQAVFGDENSPYYHDAAGYDQQQRDMAMAAQEDQVRNSIVNTYDININVDPVTLASMDVEAQAENLGNWFKNELEKAQVNFSEKE